MGCLRHEVNDHSPDILKVCWGGVGGTVSHLIGEGQTLNVFKEKLLAHSTGVIPATIPDLNFPSQRVSPAGIRVVTMVVDIAYRFGVIIAV